MLLHRILSALVLIPIVVIALFFAPMGWYALFLVVIVGLAAWEWTQFVGVHHPFAKWVYTLLFTLIALALAFGTLCCYSHMRPLIEGILYAGIVWWIVMIIMIFTYPRSAQFWHHSQFLITLFGLLTLMPFLIGMLLLRLQDPSLMGGFFVLYVLVLVWATDTGAYFAGRAFGKNKLAPRVSPGKTREGLYGGVIFALIIASLVFFFWRDVIPLSETRFFVGSVVAIIISVFGDLAESLFKRESNIKDSGKIIPGHGGVLDRIDSLTAAIPLFAAIAFLG